MPAMVLPALKAAELGERLRTLRGDDGARLGEILWQLRQERRREPNLLTHLALNNALALAGLVREARTEALTALRLWRGLPAVPPADTLNVIAGLGEIGAVEAAKELFASLDGRALEPRDERRRVESSMNLAVRFGELEWFARRHPEHPVLVFLEQQDLVAGWQAQQAAVERLVGPRVAAFGAQLVRLEEEGQALVLDYWTELTSLGDIEEMQEKLLDLLDAAGRLARLVPSVVFQVCGPQVPLGGLTP